MPPAAYNASVPDFLAASPPSPSTYQPRHVLASILASALIRGVEYGVILNQSFRFGWSDARYERSLFNALVIWMVIIALLQTVLSMYRSYFILAVHFGDWSSALALNWAGKINFTLDTLMAIPAEGFYIWRCFVLSDYNRKLLLIFLTIFAGCIGSAIAEIQIVFRKNRAFSPNPAYYTSYIAFPTVLDVIISGYLLWLLVHSRKKLLDWRASKLRIIRRLTSIAWEAFLPPALCSLALLVSFLGYGLQMAFVPGMFQGARGQLYVVSILVALQRRHVYPRTSRQDYSDSSTGVKMSDDPSGGDDEGHTRVTQDNILSTHATISDVPSLDFELQPIPPSKRRSKAQVASQSADSA